MGKYIGHRICILQRGMDQSMTNALADMDLTAAQGRIMGFIAHRKTPPCPKDIEEEFCLSHPTVSGLITRLEKKAFIELRPDQHDRRIKRIYILPKGLECTEMMHQTILRNEAQLVDNFTEEEKEQFFLYLDRAISNLEIKSCCRKNKEESRNQ